MLNTAPVRSENLSCKVPLQQFPPVARDIIVAMQKKRENHDFTPLSEEFYNELKQKHGCMEVPRDAKVFNEEELNILRTIYKERLVSDHIPYEEMRNVLDSFKAMKETVSQSEKRKLSNSPEPQNGSE